MNIFEDLIEELKDENLIEETVMETSLAESRQRDFELRQAEAQPDLPQIEQPTPLQPAVHDHQQAVSEGYQAPPSMKYSEAVIPTDNSLEDFAPLSDFLNLKLEQDISPVVPSPSLVFSTVSSDFSEDEALPLVTVEDLAAPPDLEFENAEKLHALPLIEESHNECRQEPLPELASAAPDNPHFSEPINLQTVVTDDREFFRRRATEEVTSLQVVEHILSAIEREQMKIVPKPYDDIAVIMSLHDFLKVTEVPNSIEHSQAEFKLMQETESWYSALSHRDKHISIGDLRRYCENAKPTLSSQALVSLARFYRNSPFSETVRNKFDVIVTRLLTKDVWGDKRELVFERNALIKHLSGLYADWSSIPLYDTDNDSDVLIGVLKLEDFMAEAEHAVTFEDLIKNDFFNRLRLFKESTGEKFFSPLMTGTAIESNTLVGNKYVDLLNIERVKSNAKVLEDKYRFALDQTVSNATSKTLELVELLKEKTVTQKFELTERKPEAKETLTLEPHTPRFQEKKKKRRGQFLGLSNGVLAFAVISLLALGGLYVYVEYFAPQLKSSSSVRKVNLDDSSLKEYFKTARINKDTFFAVTEPAWDKLSKDIKEDILKKTLAVGTEKGYNKIHVLNGEGKTVAFASDQGITLQSQ